MTRVDSTPERAIFSHSAACRSAGASWISLSHITPKNPGGTRRSPAPAADGRHAQSRAMSAALAANAARRRVLRTALIGPGTPVVRSQRRRGRDALAVEDVHPPVVQDPAAHPH